jgi:hypothetical protein
MVMMMNAEDEEFLISLLDDPKLLYYTYDLEHHYRHIVNEAIRNNYFHFALAFLKKMKEKEDWKAFISILLDPEVKFYQTLSLQVDEMEVQQLEIALPILELLEFVFHHDLHKHTIQDIDTNVFLNMCVLVDEDKHIEYLHLVLFDRVMNMIEMKSDEKYEVTADIMGFIQNIRQCIDIGYDEEDVVKAFSRFYAHLDMKHYYPFLKTIYEYEPFVNVALQNRSIRRHIGSVYSKYKKLTLSSPIIEDDCPICYTTLENKYFSCKKCKQNIHLSCLHTWIVEHHTCVMCRTELSKEDRNEISSFDKMVFYQNLYEKYLMKKDS